MRRILVLAIFALAASLVAMPALAQQSSTSVTAPPQQLCVCGTTVQGTDVCLEDQSCATSQVCDATIPCPAGFNCVVNECCENSPIVGRCLLDCPDGRDCINPGTCQMGFEECIPPAVPTATQWGLIALSLLFLVGTAALIIRRKSMAGAAVMLVLGLSVAGWAYGSIVNTPTTCEASDEEISLFASF